MTLSAFGASIGQTRLDMVFSAIFEKNSQNGSRRYTEKKWNNSGFVCKVLGK